MKKAKLFTMVAALVTSLVVFMGCPQPTTGGGGGGGGGVADVVFVDKSATYYLAGETRTTQKIMISGWEGSGTPYRDESDGSLKVVFEQYPQWWGGGVGIVQKPDGSTGYYDLTNVTKIKFEIKSAISASDLKFMLQWLSSTDGNGGEFVKPLNELVTDPITDWTPVEIDLTGLNGATRYGLTFESFQTCKEYVDTAMAIAWGYTSVDGNGVVTGSLQAGSYCNIRNIAFVDANGNNVAFYSNIQ